MCLSAQRTHGNKGTKSALNAVLEPDRLVTGKIMSASGANIASSVENGGNGMGWL